MKNTILAHYDVVSQAMIIEPLKMGADYIHEIKTLQGCEVIIISDLNLGGKSVTNDIENVVNAIARMEHIEPNRYMIVYSDSEGQWDGWDHKTKNHVALFEDNYKDAVLKYIKLQLNASLSTAQ